MNTLVTYADLDNALLKLEFKRQEYQGKHYLYLHKPTETLLTLPIVDAETRVRPADLLTSEKMVVERGIADADAWNALLYYGRTHAVAATLVS